MRVIVAGSRGIKDYQFVKAALDRLLGQLDKNKLVILEGAATGVDELAEMWCDDNMVPYERYHPDWDKHKKAAGLIRNSEMVNQGNASALVAIWDGLSSGTADVIGKARKRGLKVRVVLY